MSDIVDKKASCRICQTFSLEQVFRFPDHRYGDVFERIRSIARELPSHPLAISRCAFCKLLQLAHATSLDSQYLNHAYLTRVSNNLSKFYREVAKRYIIEFNLNRSRLILDIGSNDGTFLSPFLEEGFSVIGIDPSRPAVAEAKKLGINTINDYFSHKTVSEIRDMGIEIGLISINYTLANVPDLSEFFENVDALADEDTLVSIMTGYHPDQFLINMFDYISHDHLSYFTISDIDRIAKKYNFKLIDVERIEHKGGSVRLILARPFTKPRASVSQLLQREIWLSTKSNEGILAMLERVEISKQNLKKYISKSNYTSIGGVGASMSTSYLTSHYQIDEDITLLFDDDPSKIGCFSPGNGTEVKALSTIAKMDLDCIIILAWQHTEKLLHRLREIGYRGQVVVPLPTFRTLTL